MTQASAEKLEHTEPKRKSGFHATKKAVGKYARAAFAKKRMNEAMHPERQIMKREKVKVSKSRTLVRERGIRTGA